jgi:hypothetical protein
MTRRIWAIAILLGLTALLLSATQARAQLKCVQACAPVITPDPKPSDHGKKDTPQPTPTDTPQAEVLSLAQPSSTPPLVPDSGSATSPAFSQAGTQAAVFGGSPIPKNNDSFAAAPGFGPVAVPMLLVFAVIGLTSLAILKRI